MAWVNPHTWVSGEIITGAHLNQEVRDNTNYLKEHEVPTGALIMFAAAAAPAGYLLCDGSSVSRAGYAALFAVIGTTYGSVDGTHFTLPDMRSRVPIGSGAGSGLTARTLGSSGGDEEVTLTTVELPAHDHDVGAHIHDLKSFTYDVPTTSSPTFPMINQSGGSVGTITTEGASGATNTSTEGDGDPFSIMNPFLAVNFIIKT